MSGAGEWFESGIGFPLVTGYKWAKDKAGDVLGRASGDKSAEANHLAAQGLRDLSGDSRANVLGFRNEGLRETDDAMGLARNFANTELGRETASERLFSSRQNGGLDQSSRLNLEQGQQAIADQMAALGLSRSGAAAEANVKLGRGVLADQDARLAQLAQSSDMSRDRRLNTAITPYTDLSKFRGELTYRGGADAEQAYRDLQVAALGGDIAADQAKQDAFSDILGSGTRILTSLWS